MRTIRMSLLVAVVFLALAPACSSKGKPKAPAGGALHVKTPDGARDWDLATLRKLDRREAAGYAGIVIREVTGPVPAGGSVVAKGADGYTQTLSAAVIASDASLLVFEKDGQPLAAPEGPLRLMIPGSPGLSIHNLASLEVVGGAPR